MMVRRRNRYGFFLKIVVRRRNRYGLLLKMVVRRRKSDGLTRKLNDGYGDRVRVRSTGTGAEEN